MDLITDMPKSQSKTVIMIIAMQLSKSIKLIPLPELPSAFCAAELPFKHVFWPFGLTEDIMTDQGPPVYILCVIGFHKQIGNYQ